MEKLGLTHIDRFSEKLTPEYFKIDERTLVDFVEFISNFSEYINYYNTENNLDGTAKSFTAGDSTILLINISSFSIHKEQKILDRLITRFDKNEDHITDVFDFLYDFFEKVDFWKDTTVDLKDFNYEIIKIIETKFVAVFSKVKQFETDLQEVIAYTKKENNYRFVNRQIWDTSNLTTDPHIFTAHGKREMHDEIVDNIYKLFNSVISTIELIIHSSKQYLEELMQSGNTQPHIALYIAFIHMYKYAQDDINRFTERHLDFHFKDVLKFNTIPEIPDKVNLTFTLQDGIDKYKLPKDTELYAGQDLAGKDVVYRLDNEIVVSTAKVENVKSVINDGNVWSGDTNDIFEHVFIDHYLNSDIHKEEKDGKSHNFGFGLAASVLNLSEGDRKITFNFNLQRQSFDNFVERYEKEILSDININIYGLNEFVADIFSFGYTTKSESEEPEMFIIPKKNTKTYFKKTANDTILNTFCVEVDIPGIFPPISACEFDEFPLAKEKKLPLCFFFLESSKVNFYNYFKEMVIEKVGIFLHVEGIRDLKVQNQYGSLDPSTPFDPFGPNPSIGSSFILGHETIFSQKIDELQIVLDWKDVPLLPHGFPEYYQGYSEITNNQVFKVAVSALKDRKWIPEDNRQVIPLFDDITDLEDKDILPVSNIRVIDNLDLSKINDSFKGKPKVNYNDNYSRISTNGFLKFEFVYPPTGFGQTEYPKLLNQHALKSIKKGAHHEEVLNEPWSPTLNSISINFEATFLIDFNKQDRHNKSCFYHLKPFGNQLVSEPVGNKMHILPIYDHGSEIYIAVKDFNVHEILTIFINIDNLVSNSKEKTEVKWMFLMQDVWIDILNKSILADTTDDLSTSGIVTFDFSDYDKEFFHIDKLTSNQSLPKGFFYLCIKTNTGENFINRINYVSCHGAVATYFNKENEREFLPEGLPAGTISTFMDDHPDIKEVIQPFNSFGGMKEETIEDFRIRVSERMRHKNRGITKWDIEHIILQEFKDISKVICLNNTNENVEKEPGNILIVVIPNISATTTHKVLQPRSSELTLERIHNFVESVVSPFVKIKVRNPIYEQVQVKFKVKFREGCNPRYYLQIINKELREFLNPWIRENSDVNITASDNIFSVHIVYFLEKRDYVDYVTSVSVFHIIENSIINLDVAHDNNVVLSPTTDISIFVSSPEHIIEAVGGDDIHDAIGTLAIGKDFTTGYIVEKKIEDGIGKNEIEVDFEVESKKEETNIIQDYILSLNF